MLNTTNTMSVLSCFHQVIGNTQLFRDILYWDIHLCISVRWRCRTTPLSIKLPTHHREWRSNRGTVQSTPSILRQLPHSKLGASFVTLPLYLFVYATRLRLYGGPTPRTLNLVVLLRLDPLLYLTVNSLLFTFNFFDCKQTYCACVYFFCFLQTIANPCKRFQFPCPAFPYLNLFPRV